MVSNIVMFNDFINYKFMQQELVRKYNSNTFTTVQGDSVLAL